MTTATKQKSTPDYSNIKVPPGFKLNAIGVWFIPIENPEQPIFVCTPIWVASHLVAPTNLYSVTIKYADSINGSVKRLTIERGELFDKPFKLTQRLANAGALPSDPKLLSLYLSKSLPHVPSVLQEIIRTGWQKSSKGELHFVLPDGTTIGNNSDDFVFRGKSYNCFHSGSLSDWQEEVSNYCKGNPFYIFSICVALSTPLTHFINLENGGFHLFGPSSLGKTTLGQIAASVIGNGSDPSESPGSSYIRRWNMTPNALEEVAVKHNNLLLILDEIHTCPAPHAGNMVYNISGGRGRSRLSANAELKKDSHWSTQILSTGELSSRRHIESGGATYYSGQQLRLIDIPIPPDGTVKNWHGMNKTDFTRHIKNATGNCYGSALKFFVKTLICENNSSEQKIQSLLYDQIKTYNDLFFDENLSQEKQRAVRRFSLITAAGSIAAQFGIIQISENDIKESIVTIWKAWLKNTDVLSPVEQGVQNLLNFLNHNRGKFYDIELNRTIPAQIYGFYKNKVFYIYPDFLKISIGVTDYLSVLRFLNKHRFIVSGESNRLDTKILFKGSRPRVYAIRESFLGWDQTTED